MKFLKRLCLLSGAPPVIMLRKMKYIILIGVFLVLPFVLLNLLVMPALDSVKSVYENAESIANRAAGTAE